MKRIRVFLLIVTTLLLCSCLFTDGNSYDEAELIDSGGISNANGQEPTVDPSPEEFIDRTIEESLVTDVEEAADGFLRVEDSFDELLKRGEAGEPESQSRLGTLYYYGETYYGVEVEQDYEQAFFWMLKAAENGCVFDMYNVGWMYEHGEGTALDYEQAFYWFHKAGEEYQHSGAQTALGYMYWEGLGVEKDMETAAEYFLRAGGGHDGEGWRNLAHIYETEDFYIDQERAELYYMLSSRSFNKLMVTDAREILMNYLDSEGRSAIINIGTLPKDNRFIPSGLLEEAQKHYFAYDSSLFIEEYGIDCEVSASEVEFSEGQDIEFMVEYGSFYLADMDGCGEEELVIYERGGSIGNSYIRYAKRDENGSFRILFFDEIFARHPEIIEYEGKKYLAYFTYNYDGAYTGIEIYAFGSEKIEEGYRIAQDDNRQHRNYIHTYQNPDFSDTHAEQMEGMITELMSSTVYLNDDNWMYYEQWGHEQDVSEAELALLYQNYLEEETMDIHKSVDIDNDGNNEIISRQTWYSSSVNSTNHMTYTIYETDQEGNYIPVTDFRSKLGVYEGSRAVMQIFVEEFDGRNYVVLLEQELGSENYNLDVYLIENGQARLMNTHFIYMLYDIEIVSN